MLSKTTIKKIRDINFKFHIILGVITYIQFNNMYIILKLSGIRDNCIEEYDNDNNNNKYDDIYNIDEDDICNSDSFIKIHYNIFYYFWITFYAYLGVVPIIFKILYNNYLKIINNKYKIENIDFIICLLPITTDITLTCCFYIFKYSPVNSYEEYYLSNIKNITPIYIYIYIKILIGYILVNYSIIYIFLKIIVNLYYNIIYLLCVNKSNKSNELNETNQTTEHIIRIVSV